MADTNDIAKGMDVYAVDGDKIGSVAEVWPNVSNYGMTPGMTSTSSGGGPGSLGDESRVTSDTGVGGGPGSLGDESRTPTDTGVAGGPGSLGDESRVYGSSPTQTTDSTDVPENTGFTGPGDIVVEEVDVVGVGPAQGTSGTGMGDTTPGGTGAMGTATQTQTQMGIGTGYFKVDEGGFLGIGTKELYIPFDAIQDVVPGDRVVLNCTKDEADNLYHNKPDFLDQTG